MQRSVPPQRHIIHMMVQIIATQPTEGNDPLASELSAAQDRQVDVDDEYYEQPQVKLERLARLEQVMAEEIKALGEMLK